MTPDDWVVDGHPTPAELAALVAAVTALSQASRRPAQGRADRARSGWGDPRHGHRRPLAVEPGAWRR